MPLTKAINWVGTVANENDTVTLQTPSVGTRVVVINTGTNPLKIYPASGCNLGEGANGPTTLRPNSVATFAGVTTTRHVVESCGFNGLPVSDVQTGITASATQTQGQTPLTKSVNSIGTVANANDVVTLMSVIAGDRVTIFNRGVNTLQIYPASGDNVGNGANISTTVAAGGCAEFVGISSILWGRVV
ncbi:hypothetical protein CCP3SC1_70072 [Gammaproteobacteria bacterium]